MFLVLSLFRHGLSRTDYNVVNDPELSFVEVLAKFSAAQQFNAPQGSVLSEGTTNTSYTVVNPSCHDLV